MEIMTMGDYYVWYCDWCDSRNMTIWMKFKPDSICCSACQRQVDNLT